MDGKGPAPVTGVRLSGVSAGYGGDEVFHSLDLEVRPGELMALLGPSGCGKTTLLKTVAGLLPVRSGNVLFNEQAMNGVAPENRGATLVFQKALLFPHLTVGENVGFALKLKGVKHPEPRIEEALQLVQLNGFAARRVSSLSGGQEQRIAIARALAADPRVLLLDEPFSALDPSLRAEMRSLLRALQRKLGLTTIFVTHDREEAVEIADRIALMLNGKIEQVGAPRDFYTIPDSLESANFFGWQVVDGVAYRPESLGLLRHQDSDGQVESVTDYGTRIRTTLRLDSGERILVEHAPPAFPLGERLKLSVPPKQRIAKI